jgi:hypothetical protein
VRGHAAAHQRPLRGRVLRFSVDELVNIATAIGQCVQEKLDAACA